MSSSDWAIPERVDSKGNKIQNLDECMNGNSIADVRESIYRMWIAHGETTDFEYNGVPMLDQNLVSD